jgi:hypothetical protein
MNFHIFFINLIMSKSINVSFFTKYEKITREILRPNLTFGKTGIFGTEIYTKEELETFFEIFDYLNFGCENIPLNINNEDDIKKFSIALIVLQKIGHKIKMVYGSYNIKNYVDFKFELNSSDVIIQPVIYPGNLYFHLKELNKIIHSGAHEKYKHIEELEIMTDDHLNKMDSKNELYEKYVEQIEKCYMN